MRSISEQFQAALCDGVLKGETDTMENAKAWLQKIFPEVRFSSSDEAWFYAGEETDWITIINVHKGYIDDFFDPAKTIDHIYKRTSQLGKTARYPLN